MSCEMEDENSGSDGSDVEEKDLIDEEDIQNCLEFQLYDASKKLDANQFLSLIQNLNQEDKEFINKQVFYDILSDTSCLEIARYIAQHQIDLGKLDIQTYRTKEENFGILHEQCLNANANPLIIQMLIKEFQLDANIKNHNNYTPLMAACSMNHYDVAKILVEDGNASVNAKDFSHNTPLLYLCLTQHSSPQKPSDPSSGLHQIIDLRIADLLLKNGANPNVADNQTLCSPLHYAASQGNTEFVKLLIEFGADSNRKSIQGLTALQYAMRRKHENVTSLLLKFSQ